MVSEDKKINEIVEFFKTEKEREMQEYLLNRDHNIPWDTTLLSSSISLFAVLIALWLSGSSSANPSANTVAIGIYALIALLAIYRGIVIKNMQS